MISKAAVYHKRDPNSILNISLCDVIKTPMSLRVDFHFESIGFACSSCLHSTICLHILDFLIAGSILTFCATSIMDNY